VTTATAVAHSAEERIRVYVWDAVVRTTHWLIVGGITVLAITGVYIGSPFQSSGGAATPHFLMGWVKTVHFYAAMVFTLAVLARVLWMFLGPPQASWRELIPVTRRRVRSFFKTLSYYLFLSVDNIATVGHNAVAGAAYTAVFILYGVMIVTGLALYGADASLGSPMYAFHGIASLIGGLQTARFVHHLVMWFLIGFAIHHVYSALLTSKLERTGELDSMFSGNKFLEPEAFEVALETEGLRKGAVANVRR
jgi:Ni/Fe-hydrogenase 1 B-type cytochrome subunit